MDSFGLTTLVGILKYPNSIHVCVMAQANAIRMLEARRLKGVHPVFSVWWAPPLHTDTARREAGRPTCSGHVRGPACLLYSKSWSPVPG